MSNNHTPFWLALLNHCGHQDDGHRLWNGYIGWKLPSGLRGEASRSGWPKSVVHAPAEGWPELTRDEKSALDELAQANGGHPNWDQTHFMDFAGCTFDSEFNASHLTLARASFEGARFKARAEFKGARFLMQSDFTNVTFEGQANFSGAFFGVSTSFREARFSSMAFFDGVEFNGNAEFLGAAFDGNVHFDDSKFVYRGFALGSRLPICPADFRCAEFRSFVSFRGVLFGECPQGQDRPSMGRFADFSDARFLASTDFRNATFNSAPAFFNCCLHEDTDFSMVQWPDAVPEARSVEFTIRAWERLELMMGQLDKPLDRHRFYRLKMRARRIVDGRLLRATNYLFAFTSDYGWSPVRASAVWAAHWLVGGLVLLLNAGQAAVGDETLKLVFAAVGTSFANAHAFLSLAGEGGYLQICRVLVEQHDHCGLLAVVGVTQAFLGPVFIFLLLLTMRNRFRLA